jgi:DNA invertase Pin-like site-specific DNA recombinase
MSQRQFAPHNPHPHFHRIFPTAQWTLVSLFWLALFAEIESDLISARTEEGLAAAKESGQQLWRPKGKDKSSLDQYQPEIEALLENGSKKNFIAEQYKVTHAT